MSCWNRWRLGRGLAALPLPSPGDLFLDFEGDPFAFEQGLEYLVGTVTRDGGLRRRGEGRGENGDGEGEMGGGEGRWESLRELAQN